MSLVRLFYHYARWSGAVYKKLFSIVPWRTAGVALFTLISQLSLLLAFFLPLKVIILMGSTGIPRYFPQAWANIERDLLVVLLSGAAVAFYTFYMISERVVDSIADKGAQIVVDKSKKMTLFAGQEEFSKGVYQRLSRTLAAGCFFIIVSMFFVMFYPYFLIALLSYLVLIVMLASVFSNWSSSFQYFLMEKTKSFVNAASGVGFLCLFMFMVADFILWQGVGVMVAIISLLLSRQLFQKLSGAFNDGVYLYQKRLKINALFFHGHALVNDSSDDMVKSVWRFLDRKVQQYEVLGFFQQHLENGSELRLVSMSWKQPEQSGILCFNVTLESQGGEAGEVRTTLLLKIFDRAKRNLAIRENDILQGDFMPSLPSLDPVALGDIAGYPAVAYRMEDIVKVSPKHFDTSKLDFMSNCWAARPSKAFLDRYLRSHPLLVSRLSDGMLKRLEAIASNSAGLSEVRRLHNVFEEIRGVLDTLPPCVVNGSVNKHTLFIMDHEHVVASSWGNWAIEPVGAGFPISEPSLQRLPELLARAGESNPDLKEINPQAVVLAAYMAQLERWLIRQQYLEAINLIPAILKSLEMVLNSGMNVVSSKGSGIQASRGSH